MSAFKVEVRKCPGWQNRTAATLGVSVTSPNWRGEKFSSILDFAAEHFETIRLDVTDALYWHGFVAKGVPPNDALVRANALGSLWLAEHQAAISACPVKVDVVRWAEWYAHPAYTDVAMGFQKAHETDAVMREAIAADVDEFWRRKGVAPTLIQRENGRNYLLEELTVLTLQSRALPGLRIYPGEQLECLRAVRAGLVADAPRGLELEQFAKVGLRTRITANEERRDLRSPPPVLECSAG